MKAQFNFGRLWGQNFFSNLNYYRLIEYVNDEDAMKIFTNKHGLRADDKGNLIDTPLDDEHRPVIHEGIKADILYSLELLSNQMIVYISTLIENSFEEFFYCVFANDPQKIKYINTLGDGLKSQLGFSLNDFIEYPLREDYLNELSRRAAKICISGNPKAILKRVSELTKLEIGKDISTLLFELNNFRNKIVHENKHYTFANDELQKYEHMFEALLHLLAYKLIDLQIDVIDPGEFL
ncbi:hypothetical protein HQN90_14470 [Paenibacillus alba]|uniref:hypothetical protein n=1 Tax=Paenibacillus alba TaxID=1197127 RepID=UPI0015637425|nr:hypothetical protein [Paenibacillus alba]NQX67322.1 hypothetical protein [Paenibacillus alba]